MGGPDRTLHRHDFIGADIAMIPFPNKPEQFAKVTAMLQNALSLSTTASQTATAGQQYSFDVNIINDKTGHNVPSGVPFNRQLWLSVVVTDNAQNVIFSSGQLDANDDLMDRYSAFPERDSALFNAQATMLKADSSDASVWNAVGLDNPSIKPGETRIINYSFDVPNGTTGDITIDVVLKFRSFAPHLFRSLSLDSLLPIPIIDMNTDNFTVTIQ